MATSYPNGVAAPSPGDQIPADGASAWQLVASTADSAIGGISAEIAAVEEAKEDRPVELSNVNLDSVYQSLRGYGAATRGVTGYPPALAGSLGLFTSVRINAERTHHEWLTSLGTLWRRISNPDGTWQEWSMAEDRAAPPVRIFETQAEAQNWEAANPGQFALYLGGVQ